MESSTCSPATTSLKESMPHQPTTFAFPKRQFEKSKLVMRSFQAGWFRSWTWLHYHEATDSAFCFLCAKAIREKKMSSGNADTAFVNNRDRDHSCILWHVFIVLFSISKYKHSYIARL